MRPWPDSVGEGSGAGKLEQAANRVAAGEADGGDLTLKNTGIRGNREFFNIGRVRRLLANNALYGDSGASIAEFERTFGTRPDEPVSVRQAESS